VKLEKKLGNKTRELKTELFRLNRNKRSELFIQTFESLENHPSSARKNKPNSLNQLIDS
jgi:hypothetical protein